MLHFKQWTLILVLVFTTAFAIVYHNIIYHFPTVETVRNTMHDSLIEAKSKHAPKSPNQDSLIIIGIDDESFVNMNRSWPWSREVFAVFFEELQKMQPKIIALDLTLVGASPNPEADQWLARSIGENRNVLLATHFDNNGEWVSPYAPFADNALAPVYVDTPVDSDSVVRNAYVRIRLSSDSWIYSMGTHAAYAFQGLDPLIYVTTDAENAYFEKPSNQLVDSKNIATAQLSNGGKHLAPFSYRPETLNYIPFWKIISGNIKPGLLRGKMVFVGVTSSIFHDIHDTPLGMMPGVFIKAIDALTVLDSNFVRFPTDLERLFLLVLTGFIFTSLIFGISAIGQLISFLGISALVYFVSQQLYFTQNILVNPFNFLIVITFNYFTVVFIKWLMLFLDNLSLKNQLAIDRLTGLFDYRFLKLKVKQHFEIQKTQGKEFCICMMDLDHFKNINDEFGHEYGNEVIRTVADIIKKHVRKADVPARFGGDEFTILFCEANPAQTKVCLSRIKSSLDQMSFKRGEKEHKITFSAGIISFKSKYCESPERMLELADMALYEAKKSGRNQIKVLGEE